MADRSSRPEFDQFTRWVASKTATGTPDSPDYQRLHTAARAARDAALWVRESVISPKGARDDRFEVLQLLAAASIEDGRPPPELTTPRGFRVTLAYEDGESPNASSIGVLVQCPRDLLTQMLGGTVYLWNGTQRFELGQFDADGKALGILPAGIQITLADFTDGKVKLEEPGTPTSD